MASGVMRSIVPPSGSLRELPDDLFGELRWHEVDVAVERQLAVTTQAPGDLRRSVETLAHAAREPLAVVDQEAADIVVFRRLDSDGAQHALERELDELLRSRTTSEWSPS